MPQVIASIRARCELTRCWYTGSSAASSRSERPEIARGAPQRHLDPERPTTTRIGALQFPGSATSFPR